ECLPILPWDSLNPLAFAMALHSHFRLTISRTSALTCFSRYRSQLWMEAWKPKLELRVRIPNSLPTRFWQIANALDGEAFLFFGTTPSRLFPFLNRSTAYFGTAPKNAPLLKNPG